MKLTIHSFTLQLIVSIIFGEEELEVSLWILDRSNFVFLVDKVSGCRLDIFEILKDRYKYGICICTQAPPE